MTEAEPGAQRRRRLAKYENLDMVSWARPSQAPADLGPTELGPTDSDRPRLKRSRPCQAKPTFCPVQKYRVGPRPTQPVFQNRLGLDRFGSDLVSGRGWWGPKGVARWRQVVTMAGIRLHEGKTRVWNKAGECPEEIAELGPEVWSPEGVKILGTPVGSGEFVARVVAERLVEDLGP